jgi:hypothetical protein
MGRSMLRPYAEKADTQESRARRVCRGGGNGIEWRAEVRERMRQAMNHPVMVFVVTLVVLWIAARVGVAAREKRGEMDSDERDDFGVLLTATLTLLGLIIGFTFSMAISRYDQRKNYEEEEANAIGTEYLRVELLPGANAGKVQELLKSYLAARVQFYQSDGGEPLREINARTAELQDQLWNEVKQPAGTTQTALMILVVSGMNDVLNTQGYTQASWWNRIPIAAWALMWAIAICSTFMIGYYLRPAKRHWVRLIIMPVVVSISFLLIADIDSPRGGIIRVLPQNLVNLQQGLK